jgi:hypothetical protein
MRKQNLWKSLIFGMLLVTASLGSQEDTVNEGVAKAWCLFATSVYSFPFQPISSRMILCFCFWS